MLDPIVTNLNYNSLQKELHEKNLFFEYKTFSPNPEEADLLEFQLQQLNAYLATNALLQE